MKPLKGICVGAGYFAQFHFDAWRRMTDDVQIIAVCDSDSDKAKTAAAIVGALNTFASLDQAFADDALVSAGVDFVDLITPPAGRLELVQQCCDRGVAVITQKPVGETFVEAKRIIMHAQQAGIRLMVHENFRFQPWRRETKRLIDEGAVGKVHTVTIRTRLGDGWGDDAYLARQPYFREMPRLLMHETGVHFLDTLRYLVGEADQVSAILRKMNPVIAGEDAALVTTRFANGAIGVWDANRYNESNDDKPRLTFGDTWVEGDRGTIRTAGDGRLFVKPLGEPEQEHPYQWSSGGFAGDCVLTTQQHFIDCLRSGEAFETDGVDYLNSLQLVEAAYDSHELGSPVSIASRPRVVDLSRGIDPSMPGVGIRPAKRLETDGWNATTLSLYSHSGTHMDAPQHFLPGGETLEQQSLDACCGPAKVVDLTPVEPAELITVERFRAACGDVSPGQRLLLRTDWHQRYPGDDFRNALPRISLELAEFFVEREVSLIGVEPPSVADVNNMQELTDVHQTLFRGGVTIVEGLCNLNELTTDSVEFIALPLKVIGGDGSPVRAVAITS